MAVEKEQHHQQPPYPPPEVNPYGRVDEELVAVADKESRRKKRMKCFLYVILFAVFQTGVIALFALTIMRVRTPRFRVQSATFTDFNVNPSNPSFNIRMNTQLAVRNTNFGHYRYQNSTVEFYYRDMVVGTVMIPRARARARSTRRFNVIVDLSATNLAGLGTELGGGVLRLSSRSRLRGRVELMRVIRRNRSTNMDCTMEIHVASRELRNVVCR